MTEFRIESLQMPAADLGPEGPLSPLVALKSYDPTAGSAPGQFRMGPLPHAYQNGYNRRRTPRSFIAVVLENEHLRALFLPELGGRLWSLIDKASDQELLEVNPVFQPANLSVRGAWFSGGVEWNIGIKGHTPHTVSPLFAARVQGPDGTPSLRLYEWCRIRQTPFQIDAMLPSGSRVLLVRMRIVNPRDVPVDMYWWSNIAVPETPGTRVIAPAHSSYCNDYSSGQLREVPVPVQDGQDRSYPARAQRAGDLFFKLTPTRRPWIAALDPEGNGLVQCSTPLLGGRKLFHWGDTTGGRNWQRFLSDGMGRYIEIQAGLARTQHEYVQMPPGRWEWIEAYGRMQSDPSVTHGPDWSAAINHVAGALETMIPAKRLQAILADSAAIADTPPGELFCLGSPWGALEQQRRAADP